MFSPLAMLAGDPAGAYRQGRQQQQQVDVGDDQKAGDDAFGRALMAMYGQSMAPPTVPPGQPSMPGRPPMGGPPMGGPPMGGPPQMPAGAFPQPQPMGGAPGMPPGAPPSFPGAGAPPPMQRPPGFGGGPGGPPISPGGGGPPPGPGMPPMGSGGGAPGGPQGGLTWQAAAQAVIRANPGIDKNPRALARAIDHFLPIMNQQSLQEWRQQRPMIVEMQQQGATTRTAMQQSGATERAGMKPDVSTIAKWDEEHPDASAEERAKFIEGVLKGGQRKSEIAGKREAGVQGRFEAREGRLERHAQVREDQAIQRLDMQRQNLERQIQQGGARQKLGEWRAVIDAQHKRAMEIIQSATAGGTGMPDAKERARLMKEEDQFYRQQIENMRSGGGNKDMKTGPGTIEGIKLNEMQLKDPDGTRYPGSDGKIYIKRGNTAVPEDKRSMSDEQPDAVRGGQRYASNEPPSGNVQPIRIQGSGNTSYVRRPDGRWVQHDNFGPVGLMPVGWSPPR